MARKDIVRAKRDITLFRNSKIRKNGKTHLFMWSNKRIFCMNQISSVYRLNARKGVSNGVFLSEKYFFGGKGSILSEVFSSIHLFLWKTCVCRKNDCQKFMYSSSVFYNRLFVCSRLKRLLVALWQPLFLSIIYRYKLIEDTDKSPTACNRNLRGNLLNWKEIFQYRET